MAKRDVNGWRAMAFGKERLRRVAARPFLLSGFDSRLEAYGCVARAGIRWQTVCEEALGRRAGPAAQLGQIKKEPTPLACSLLIIYTLTKNLARTAEVRPG